MRSAPKRSLSVLGIAALVMVGGAGAHAAMGESTPPSNSGATQSDASHPECYDAQKLNDPNDYCYQTIGPWNSTLSNAEEVRSLVSLEKMVQTGMKAEEIRRYYPEYQPSPK